MSALVQGSEEWLEMRKKKIGASDAPIIMGVSPWKTPKALWEEKLSIRNSDIPSIAMLRGVEMEDEARLVFEEMTGIYVFKRVMQHPVYDWMIASLDGIDIEEKNIVEIKCPGKKDHAVALEGRVPDKYYPQLQHQLYVCNLPKIYYFSYNGTGGVVVEVMRNEEYQERLIKEELKFWDCILNFIPPE
jgi:putative phage-type endonuclease